MFIPEIKSRIGEDICILLKLDNHTENYICECGDASELTVKECQNTKAIFISHTHIDHFINFDFVLRHQIGIGKKIIICGPEGIAGQVQSKINGYRWNLIEKDSITYEIREIKNNEHIERYKLVPPIWELQKLESFEENMIFKNDRFTVNFVILDHKTPSIAYLFKEIDTVNIDLSKSEFKGGAWIQQLKSAYENENGSLKIEINKHLYKAKDLFHLLQIKKGDSVGIIMDHAANPSNHAKIKSLFSNQDKVFIECFYKAEDKEFAAANYHSYSIESAKIMKSCGVKEAIPVHFSRKYKEEEIITLRNGFDKIFKS